MANSVGEDLRDKGRCNGVVWCGDAEPRFAGTGAALALLVGQHVTVVTLPSMDLLPVI